MGYPRLIAPALALAALLTASATSAQEAASTVVRDGDAAMTCEQMGEEAAELSAEMGEGGGGGLLGKVRAVAETGAAILVPGAGLAMAGADALTTSGAERREAEAVTGRDRWNYLNGLYAGRGCADQQAATVEPASAVQAGPTVTPVQTGVAVEAEIANVTPAPRITPTALPQ